MPSLALSADLVKFEKHHSKAQEDRSLLLFLSVFFCMEPLLYSAIYFLDLDSSQRWVCVILFGKQL